MRRRRRRRPATRSAETPHSTHRSLINQAANPRSRRCPFPCRHSPLFASNSPVSLARDRTESPLPADDPHDSLLPPFVTRVARDNPPSPAPAPPQLRASSPIGYPIRLTRSRRLRSLYAHRHSRPRHVRLHRPRCPAPLATFTPGRLSSGRALHRSGGADPRSPQHPPLSAHPYLSAHCYPRSDSLPCSRDSARNCLDRPHQLPHRRATTATSRPVPPTERRTRSITAAPPPLCHPLLARSQQQPLSGDQSDYSAPAQGPSEVARSPPVQPETRANSCRLRAPFAAGAG